MTGRIVILIIAARFGSLAATPAPFAAERRMLDNLVAQSPDSPQTLAILTGIALGRGAANVAELASQIGVTTERLRSTDFTADTMREYAFFKIGEMRLEQAVHFLQSLTPSDIGRDSSLRISWAAKIALQNSLLNRIDVEGDKVRFLEHLIEEPRNAIPAVRHWAVNQLCDRASLVSIGVLRPAIMYMAHGSDGEEQVQFCEARIYTLLRHSNRVKALDSALHANETKLVRWAIHQLADMHSSEADSVLTSFQSEIERHERGNPSISWRHSLLKDEVESILSSRGQAVGNKNE